MVNVSGRKGKNRIVCLRDDRPAPVYASQRFRIAVRYGGGDGDRQMRQYRKGQRTACFDLCRTGRCTRTKCYFRLVYQEASAEKSWSQSESGTRIGMYSDNCRLLCRYASTIATTCCIYIHVSLPLLLLLYTENIAMVLKAGKYNSS